MTGIAFSQPAIGQFIDALRAQAVIALDDSAFALRGSQLLRWSESGYVERIACPPGIASVLTPPSIVAVLAAGYKPQWHPSAD